MDTFKRELKFLPYVFMESKRSFITRIQYWLTRPFFKNKKIWLMYDKLYKGGDSCEYLYRYCADKKDGISRYYIIDKNTSDYKRLKADGLKPVKNRSFKHKMLFLNTDIALITNSNVFPFNGYSMDRSRFIRGLCNFLQCAYSTDFRFRSVQWLSRELLTTHRCTSLRQSMSTKT